MTQNDDYILVANIGKPIGLKGWIKINSFTRPEENIKNYKEFFLGKKKEFVTFDQIKKSGKNLITKLNNYDSIEEVEKFKNFDVFIKSSELPELKKNQFYWKDLIDMEGEVSRAASILFEGAEPASEDAPLVNLSLIHI